MKTIDLLTFGGEEVKCVRLTDYEALKAENEQLRAEIERAAIQKMREQTEEGVRAAHD